ncbi:unnamed protein product [Pieris brassicae]|uniref:Uncharacterized protein n=1 Tax=Pieris brassicae TaxID=7116 RepID=A0A9P0TPR5_PIEBR|nr:unnamed protein product [Pieris brassicae]
MYYTKSELKADEDDWPGGTLDGVDNDVEERTKAKACGSGEQEVSNESEVAADSDHDEEIFDDIEDDCPNKSSEALDLGVAVLLLGQHERCANVFSAGVMGGVCGEKGAAGAAEPEVGRVGLFPREPDAGTALGSLAIVLCSVRGASFGIQMYATYERLLHEKLRRVESTHLSFFLLFYVTQWQFGPGRSQVARPQRLELSHSGEASGRRAGGGPNTFVTGPPLGI